MILTVEEAREILTDVCLEDEELIALIELLESISVNVVNDFFRAL